MHEKFKARRKELNITLKQMSAALDVSESFLCKYEQGKTDLPLKVAYNAAKILGLKLVLG